MIVVDVADQDVGAVTGGEHVVEQVEGVVVAVEVLNIDLDARAPVHVEDVADQGVDAVAGGELVVERVEDVMVGVGVPYVDVDP